VDFPCLFLKYKKWDSILIFLLQVFVNMTVPSQCITATKSTVRGRKRGRPLSKYKRKGDVYELNPEISRTVQGRKSGKPLGCNINSRASLSSPVRKSVKVSVRNKEHLLDTDKGTVKEVST
jgi:hypothetical protein